MDDHVFEQQLKREFLEEAEEIIQAFEGALIQLETAPKDQALLNKLFRDAHTLKGSGLAAGFTAFGHCAHKLENVLEQLRAGKLILSKKVATAILLGSDALKAWVRLLKKNFDAPYDCSKADAALLACLQGEAAPPADVESFEPQLLTPIVYVCDDEPELLEMLVDVFPPSWKVEGFSRGLQLLERVAAQVPHLVISDLKMPGISGEELTRKLREAHQNLPVIFISGHASREDVIRFIKLGAVDFFEKPFIIDELLTAARRALRNMVQEQALLDLSTLAFRTYLRFTRIEDLIDPEALTEGKREKLIELEKAMTRMGQLSLGATRFGQEKES